MVTIDDYPYIMTWNINTTDSISSDYTSYSDGTDWYHCRLYIKRATPLTKIIDWIIKKLYKIKAKIQ